MTLSSVIDLEAYFARIEWGGSSSPTLETLTGLLSSHISRIPFENFDVLIGRPIRLDVVALQDKIIKGGRGGYCFEHATLFNSVLKALGFSLQEHAARITRAQPRSEAHRGHMFATVNIDGSDYVVDPGFSAYASQLPLLLEESEPISGATHYLTRDGREWILNVALPDAQFRGWMSTLEREIFIDFEIANHFTYTHPSSIFTQVIMASAVTPRGRVNILNNSVNYLFDDVPRKEHLQSRSALRAVVSKHFGFDLPELETIRVPTIPDWN